MAPSFATMDGVALPTLKEPRFQIVSDHPGMHARFVDICAFIATDLAAG
jgi:hypothetical protein